MAVEAVGFIKSYDKVERELLTDCGIATPFDLEGLDAASLQPRFYKAIWDTGATSTSVTERVAAECGLKPTGITKLYTVGSEEAQTVDTSLASIFLPNNVVLPKQRVLTATIEDADILIGMDIIGLGDFLITNHNGKTTLYYRFPSIGADDFPQEVPGE